MPDLSHEPTDSRASNAIAARPRPSRLQFGLRSLFLSVAAIAVWTTYFNNRHRMTALEADVAAMRPLTNPYPVLLMPHYADRAESGVMWPLERYRLHAIWTT